VTRGQCRYQWARRKAIGQARVRFLERELELKRRLHAFHLKGYTGQMLVLRQAVSSPERQAEIEKSYFAATGKSLQDALGQAIVAALKSGAAHGR